MKQNFLHLMLQENHWYFEAIGVYLQTLGQKHIKTDAQKKVKNLDLINVYIAWTLDA